MKKYRINPQIGRAKHSVSFHDGHKTHSDGSEFWDLWIFSNRRALDKFVRELQAQGYKGETND